MNTSTERNSMLIKIIISVIILFVLGWVGLIVKNYFFPTYPTIDLSNKKIIVYGSKFDSSLLGKKDDNFENEIISIDKDGKSSIQNTSVGVYGYIGITSFDSNKYISTYGPRRFLNVKPNGENSIQKLYDTDPYASAREDGQVIGSRLDLTYATDTWLASSVDAGETSNGSFVSYKKVGTATFKSIQLGLITLNSMWIDGDMLYYTAFDNNRTSNYIVKYDLLNEKEVLNVKFVAEETYVRAGEYSQLYPKIEKINGKFLLTKDNNTLVLLDPETLTVVNSVDLPVEGKNISIVTTVIDGRIYVSGGVLGVFDNDLHPVDAVTYNYPEKFTTNGGAGYPTNFIFKDGIFYDLVTLTHDDNTIEVHVLESDVTGKFLQDVSVTNIANGANWNFHVFDVL